MAGDVKLKEVIKARNEFNDKVEEKFLNKNYYNPEYMYNTEGPEILRLYNNRDNTEHYDFTDVLDSVYNNVRLEISSGSALNFTTPCSSAPSSMPLNLNGPFTIPTRKALFRLSSEESML
jgi:hypothetical protein